MALKDLGLIVLHYAKLIISVSVVCALAAGGFAYASSQLKGPSYRATCTLTVTDMTGLLNASSLSNLMSAVANIEVAGALDQGLAVSVVSDSQTQSLKFTATSSSEIEAMNLANDMADQTIEAIELALAKQSEAYLDAAKSDSSEYASGLVPSTGGVPATDRAAALKSCVYTVQPAQTAVMSGSGDVMKYAIVGLIGSLFLMICLFAIRDSIYRPVKNKEDVARVTDLPILAVGNDTQAGERIWANICFAGNSVPDSVCVLPIAGEARSDIAVMLENSFRSFTQKTRTADSGDLIEKPVIEVMPCPVIESCSSLQEDSQGVRVAHEVSSTIVVVQPWVDGAVALEETLSELQLVRANIVGVVIA